MPHCGFNFMKNALCKVKSDWIRWLELPQHYYIIRFVLLVGVLNCSYESHVVSSSNIYKSVKKLQIISSFIDQEIVDSIISFNCLSQTILKPLTHQFLTSVTNTIVLLESYWQPFKLAWSLIFCLVHNSSIYYLSLYLV